MSQGWLQNSSENLFRETRGKTTQLWKVEKERKGCSGKWPLCKPNSPHGIFLWYTPSDASHTSPRGGLAKQNNWKLSANVTGGNIPCWLSGKEPTCRRRSHRRHTFNPWIRKVPRRMKWQPNALFSPGKAQGQRSQAGYSPWGRRAGHGWACMHCTANEPGDDQTKQSHSDGERQRPYGIMYMWNLNIIQVNLCMKQLQTHIGNRLVVAKGYRGMREGKIERSGLAVQIIMHRMNKQSPTRQHRELYPIFWDKP